MLLPIALYCLFLLLDLLQSFLKLFLENLDLTSLHLSDLTQVPDILVIFHSFSLVAGKVIFALNKGFSQERNLLYDELLNLLSFLVFTAADPIDGRVLQEELVLVLVDKVCLSFDVSSLLDGH